MKYKVVCLLSLLISCSCLFGVRIRFDSNLLLENLSEGGFRHFVDETCINTALVIEDTFEVDQLPHVVNQALSIYYPHRFKRPDDQKDPAAHQREILQIILLNYLDEFQRLTNS